jgi:hypothetical protein
MTAPKTRSTNPRAVYMRSYRAQFARTGGATSTPCYFCSAPDARQPDHATGCPTLVDLSREKLVSIARNVERGWAPAKTGDTWRDKTGIAMRAKGADA